MTTVTVVKPSQLPQIQVSKVWDKLTAKIEIGEYIRLPYTPIVQVLDRYEHSDARVSLYVKTRTGAVEEWRVKPEPTADLT